MDETSFEVMNKFRMNEKNEAVFLYETLFEVFRGIV